MYDTVKLDNGNGWYIYDCVNKCDPFKLTFATHDAALKYTKKFNLKIRCGL